MNKKRFLIIALIVTTALVLSACNLLSMINSDTSSDSDTDSAAVDTNVLYSDDFSSSSSGWDRASGDEGYTDYSNDAYEISVDVANYDLWANPGEYFTDVSVETDATLVSGTEDNDIGVICRYQDVSNFYFAVIASDGYYGIGKVADGSQEYLTDGLPSTDLVNTGYATNHIRFDCVGSSLSLYINGDLAESVSDSDFSAGDAGLMAGTFDTPGVVVSFDNFVVYQP
jgi:hypothetical protein